MLWRLFVLRLFHTQCVGATTLAAWSQRASPGVVSALQQQPAAVAPSHKGTRPRNTDFGEWGFMPPLGVGGASRRNEHISQMQSGLPGSPAEKIIQQRRDSGVLLCVTTSGYLLGGLSNSMGVVNTVMDFAMKNNATFVMPDILPPDHDLGNNFATMFGSEPACATRTLRVWPASCPAASMELQQYPPKSARPNFHGCNVSEEVVADPYMDTTTACGCDEMLLMGTANLAWSYDYSRTGRVLSEKYWPNAEGTRSHNFAMTFPLRTAMHIRLGDVEDKDSTKFFPGDSYVQLALALTSFIDPACLQVTILTDGEADDENVRAPFEVWTKLGANSTEVLDITTPANVSLNTMARADVLVGGASGFPRFAAVLGGAQFKFFLGDFQNTHPIHYLSGVTEIGPRDIKSDTIELAGRVALRQNKKVAELAAACREWLENPGKTFDLSAP